MPPTKTNKTSWRWWRSQVSHHKEVALQPKPPQPTPPPPYDTTHPIPSPVYTDIPITSALHDLEIVLLVADVCSNIAAGARIQNLPCGSKASVVDKIAKAFTTAIKPGCDSWDATASVSASIARTISHYNCESSKIAVKVAMEAILAIDNQVAAAIHKRATGYEYMDSWNYIIRTATATTRSISCAANPGAAASSVAGAFEGLI